MDLWHGVMALCLQIQYIVQRTQSKLFRAIADIPWYVSNKTLHDDPYMLFVRETIPERSHSHHIKINLHTNFLVQLLLKEQRPIKLRRQMKYSESSRWRSPRHDIWGSWSSKQPNHPVESSLWLWKDSSQLTSNET